MLIVQPHVRLGIMENQTPFMEPHMQTALSPCIVPVKEAARLLSISRAKTYGMLASGELKSVKIGRSRPILLSEMQRLCHAYNTDQLSNRCAADFPLSALVLRRQQIIEDGNRES